jgi:cysteine desulfurase
LSLPHDAIAPPDVEPVYLDHNATTPVDPAVLAAMMPYLTTHFGNPSSDHRYGRTAARAVAEARTRVAGLVGAEPDEVVFVASGSEANNLAVRGVADAARNGGAGAASVRRTVVTCAVEHPSVLRTCAALEREGWRVVSLGVDGSGRVDLDHARAAIDDSTLLVSVQYANGETGTIQPLAEVAAIAREHGALVHTDACQAVGKVDVDLSRLGVDLLTLAGHKMYAPKGVAALVRRRDVRLRPLTYGGGQEGGLRAGTENVPYVVALGAASAVARGRLPGEGGRLAALRDLLHDALCSRLDRPVLLNGHPSARLPNTLNVSVDGTDGRAVLAGTPQVAASTGSACHAGRPEPSEVLLAMGLSRERASAALRLSVGAGTAEADVLRAADSLAATLKGLEMKSAS